MDLLHANVKTAYFKYLSAAFGSALIGAVYSIVDMAVVGQYQGPQGTAALAVVAPVWNILYSLGLLTGIGGAVLCSAARGCTGANHRTQNEYFTAALGGTLFLALISWAAIVFFDRQMLLLFGAQETLLPLAQRYLLPVKFAAPLFVINQMLAAFLRNDNHPGLATAGVLAGGVFNIGADYVFVFGLELGIFGAGLATALGALITFAVMMTHFFSTRNTLRLVRPRALAAKLRKILITGFSTFFIDVAMGVLTMLFNRQIMRYLGTDALAVYGVIVNVSTIVQCCAYSVGQAAQPILSVHFGAGQSAQIRSVLKYALQTVWFFSAAWTALIWAFPNGFIHMFMTPTPAVLAIAPLILRCYGLSFLLLPLNVFSTYYFQALMRPGASFAVSAARGAAISGALIYCLPRFAGANALWLAMPLTELGVAVAVAFWMVRYTKALCEAPDGARKDE